MAEKKDPSKKTIPIDDVSLLEIDRSIFTYLKDNINLTINSRKVPVLFGAWERFAQMQEDSDKNLNTMRDQNGKLKLPLISVRRDSVENNTERYKNDNANNIKIQFYKKIAESNFDSQRRVPFNSKWQINSGRYKSENPVYELHSLPWPTFINVSYTITFWCSYIKHANEFHNRIWNNIEPGDIGYKGYFFHTRFESSSDDSPVEDFSAEERTFRHTFPLELEAYLINKKEVVIDRTISKFAFEEEIIEADGDSIQDSLSIFPN